MKKLISLCLAMILALALAVPASAASDGGVKVQVNGQLVTFPNADPEVVNGRTMVPMRAVLETLGATVEYEEATATATAVLGGITITHVIGTDKIDISGQDPLTMDTVSYVQNGSTLVPLRFFSQALGYQVYWDDGAATAVVIDRKAVIEEIDKSFTILNNAQAKRAEALDPSGNWKMDMDFSGEAKLLDSINGDKALPFSMKMSALYNSGAMNMEGTMDLSILAALLGGEDEAEAKALESMLKDLSFQMIYGEALWMQIPALTDYLRRSGEELPEGEVWLKTAAGDMAAMDLSGSTIGGTLYAMAERLDADEAASLYGDLTQTAQAMTALMGDDTFTRNGEDYAWKLDEAASRRLAEAMGASSVSLPLTAEMTLKADGSADYSMALTVEQGPVAVAMSMSGTSTNTSATVKGQIQVKNVCDVTFQGEAKTQAGDAVPVSAPAEGAAVIDLDEMASIPTPLPELPAA